MRIPRILLSVLITLIVTPAVYADVADGTSPLLVFHQKNPNDADIIYTKPENLPKSDEWFRFVPINGNTTAQEYSFNASGYFIKTPAPRPSPDLQGFLDVVEDDASIPLEFHQYVPMISRLVDRPRRLWKLWERVTASPPEWMTRSMIQQIQDYAAKAHMPLIDENK